MKIVILSFDLPEANVVTHRLLREIGGDVIGIMHSTSIVGGKDTLPALVQLGRRMGWRYGGSWQLHRWLAKIGDWRLRLSRKPAGYGSLSSLAREAGIPLVPTANAHSEQSLDVLKAWAPDLIVSNYFNQLIRQPILQLPSIGTINMHPALLPRNRGLMPCFWALASGDETTGATVHWVDSTLDTGRVIFQDSLPIHSRDSVISVSERCSARGAELLLECIRQLREGTLPGIPQDESARTYHSWPTRGGIRRLYRRGHRYGSVAEMWRQVGSPRAPVNER